MFQCHEMPFNGMLTIPSEACARLVSGSGYVWCFGCMRIQSGKAHGLSACASACLSMCCFSLSTQFQQLKFPSGTSTVASSWFNCPSRPLRYSLFYYFARHWTWPVCVRTILFFVVFLLMGRLGWYIPLTCFGGVGFCTN